jgi:uncharacterized protein (DUF2062 family)
MRQKIYNSRMVNISHFSRYPLRQLSQSIKRQWQTLIQTNDSPNSIALAFAIGTFISVLPTPGLNIPLATLLASLFKQLNRAGLLTAIAVWNALVVAPIYALSHKVGSFVTASLPIIPHQQENPNLFIAFLVGNLLLATFITGLSFLIVQAGMTRYKTQKARA